MPTLPDVLAKLSFLMTMPTIVGLVITASLIVVIRDWRFLLTALLGQYVLVGLLLTQLIQPQVAVIKVLIGALVCVVLYLTARLVDVRGKGSALEQETQWIQNSSKGIAKSPLLAWIWRSRPSRIRSTQTTEDSRSPLPEIEETSLPDLAFRLLAVLLVGLAVYSLSRRYPLPEVPSDIGFACYWLASLGLLVLLLTDEPLKAGMGLLTLITGFELFYSALERSLSVAGLLGIANFLIALAVAYLSTTSEAELTTGEGER